MVCPKLCLRWRRHTRGWCTTPSLWRVLEVTIKIRCGRKRWRGRGEHACGWSRGWWRRKWGDGGREQSLGMASILEKRTETTQKERKHWDSFSGISSSACLVPLLSWSVFSLPWFHLDVPNTHKVAAAKNACPRKITWRNWVDPITTGWVTQGDASANCV